MADAGILDALVAEFHREHQSLLGWGVGWARVLPTVFLVPAFGLGILPASLRAALALALGVAIAPAVQAVPVPASSPWPAVLATEALRGLPIALSASISLWVATVAGGVADTASRGTRLTARDGALGRPATPLATLFGLAAAIVFLESGSVARLVGRLASAPPFATSGFLGAAMDLGTGIGIGASIGAPLLLVGLAVDVASGLAARERASASFDGIFVPLRTLVVVVATAALLDRMLEAAILLSPGRP